MLLAILPDTPESEVAELVATTFEGTLWAGAIQPLIRVFKTLKNVPAYMNQQTATAVAGGAGAGAAVDQQPKLDNEITQKDNQVGIMPKLEAHEKGLLHRAFSIFIFNNKYQLLLQKRAVSKYHSGGLWTNTCCSHPREGEEILDAANRRLIEEMGIETSLRKVHDFIYKAELDNNLTEHEFDHVFYGIYNEDPIINKDEADDFKWIDMDSLNEDIKTNGDNYTIWFKIAFEYFYNYLKK